VAGVPLRHLSDLVDQSLLSVSADRYAMHQLVGQYAAERLRETPGQAAALAHRHASWTAQAMHGRHRTGRRRLDRALRKAQALGMPWERAEARRRMAALD
jgi:hypothetical protein